MEKWQGPHPGKKGILFREKLILKEVFMAAANLQKQLEKQESPQERNQHHYQVAEPSMQNAEINLVSAI